MVSSSTTSSTTLPPLPVPRLNDCVTIRIPEVDRGGKMNAANLIGVVVGIEERDGHPLYEVATEHGRVNSLLSRNQFELSRRRDIIDLSLINTDESKSIREMAAGSSSTKSSSSSIKCHCYSNGCQNKRCLCRRKGVLCTEKCLHGRNSKTGKIDERVARAFQCKNK